MLNIFPPECDSRLRSLRRYYACEGSPPMVGMAGGCHMQAPERPESVSRSPEGIDSAFLS